MKSIKYIGNTYGGLIIKQENDKYYWIINDYNTNFEDIEEWEEISKQLYNELLKHNDEK